MNKKKAMQDQCLLLLLFLLIFMPHPQSLFVCVHHSPPFST